ncbi:hypothetical protein FOZ60_002570 [Perkinsus olseni]|uniref:C2H2-type domain-containing protein n=1 Tax=Perkinsus olseni TaxID=32597 RepID=A0A7J6NXH8_PEROL|nr:hypothetical protein FOZ60_002570 [Perkinsus olseni]
MSSSSGGGTTGIAGGLKRLAEFNKALSALPSKASEEQVKELCGLAMEMPDEAYDVVLAISNDIKNVGNRAGAAQQQRIKTIISLVDGLLKAKPGGRQTKGGSSSSVDNSYRIYILKSIDDIFVAALKRADQSTHNWLNRVLEMWKDQGNALLPERILNRLTAIHANVKPQVKSILKGSGGGGSAAPHPSGSRSSSAAATTAAGKGEKPFAAEVALAERELALIGMIQSKSFKNSKDRKDAMRIYEVRQAATYLKEGKRKEASKTLSDAKKKYSHMVEALKAKQADAIKKANEAAAAAASVSSSSDDVVDTAMEEMPSQSKRARLAREERESSSSPEPPTKRKKSAAEATGSTSSESEHHEEGREEGKIPSGVLGSPPNDLPPMEFSLEWIQHFFTMMSSKIPYHPSHDVLLPTKVKTVEQTQEQRVIVDGLSQHELLLILRFIERLETNIRVQVAETRKLAAAAAASGKKNQGLSQKALAHIQVPHKFRLLHSMGDPSTSGLLDLYFNMPVQCGTCALRFAVRQDLLDHHDAHYLKTTMLQRRVKQVEQEYRGWNEAVNDWFDNKGTPMLGRDICKSLIDSATKASADGGEDTASTAATETKSNVTRRGFISDAVRLEEMLRHASPYDPVKTKCLECGDELEEEWADEPVDMPVFRDTVVVPIGSSVPVHFLWPGMSSEDDVDSKEKKAAEGEPQPLTVDAAMASARDDYRMHNTLYFHRDCWIGNPTLKDREYQQRLLVVEAQRPSPSSAEAEEKAAMEVDGGAEVEGVPNTRIIVEEGVEGPEGVGGATEEQKALEMRRSQLVVHGRRKRF